MLSFVEQAMETRSKAEMPVHKKDDGRGGIPCLCVLKEEDQRKTRESPEVVTTTCALGGLTQHRSAARGLNSSQLPRQTNPRSSLTKTQSSTPG